MIDICFSKHKVECMNASEPADVEINHHFALVQDSIIPTGDSVVLRVYALPPPPKKKKKRKKNHTQQKYYTKIKAIHFLS